jgi:energy-coupling factor transporter ATP-binding protein EcfA2
MVYLGASVLRDLDIDGLVDSLPTFTKVGADALRERLSHPIADEIELTKRQAVLRSIKANTAAATSEIKALRTQLRNQEDSVRSVAEAAADTRHAEYYTQILWGADSRFAWLNKLGWLNELIVGFRTLFLPALSILLPLLVLLAPLLFFTVIAKEPLTVEGYFGLLQKSLKTAMPSILGKPRFAGTGGMAELGEQFVHIGAAIAMFVASIWNQISAAISMRAVVADMRVRANAVATFTEATRSLATRMGVPLCPALQEPWSDGELGVFGHAWNAPDRVREILAFAGHLDMLACLATAKRTCFVKESDSLSLTDLYHPGVPRKERVYNSVTMAADISGSLHQNVLLTGPNRGGKSTLLKAIGVAVLMSHTVGIVFAREARIPRFANIITALAPADVVGKLSLFEAEIEFAKDVKERLGPLTFLMMDEIFHGTNAHDGVEASQVFLDQLYDPKVRGLFSIVSTHYMNLPERYKEVQHLCMDAAVNPNDPDRLVYTYKVREGVNRFSSVREILRERGLLCDSRLCGSAD